MKMLKIAIAFATLAASLSVATSASAQQAGNQKPLYERLGGLKGITVVVDHFINKLVVNKTLNKNPAINAGRTSSPAPYLKFQVAQLVCEAAGGPCKYTGQGMKESHAHLNITEQEWGVMAKVFQKTLNKFKVPAAEQRELFEIVGKLKGDIVIK